MSETEVQPENKNQKSSMPKHPDEEWLDCQIVIDKCDHQKYENRRGVNHFILTNAVVVIS